MLFLDFHGDGVSVANIFWGLWLWPFGRLIIRSAILPRPLGFWLIANSLALVAVSMTSLVVPAWTDPVSKAAIPAELGELATVAWLIVMGARAEPLRQAGQM